MEEQSLSETGMNFCQHFPNVALLVQNVATAPPLPHECGQLRGILVQVWLRTKSHPSPLARARGGLIIAACPIVPGFWLRRTPAPLRFFGPARSSDRCPRTRFYR